MEREFKLIVFALIFFFIMSVIIIHQVIKKVEKEGLKSIVVSIWEGK